MEVHDRSGVVSSSSDSSSVPRDPAPQRDGGRGRGRGQGRGNKRDRDDNPDVKLSKRLCSVLRHKAESLGLSVRPDGFIRLADVLRTPGFSGVTVDRIRQLVADNTKQRFTLEEDKASGDLLIRANQGHSMSCIDETQLLRRIGSLEEVPECVVHGTYGHAWATIKRDGLKRMARTHVHMAKGLPGEGGVISGYCTFQIPCPAFYESLRMSLMMKVRSAKRSDESSSTVSAAALCGHRRMRTSAHIAVYIDVRKAISEGLEFFESSNGVVLCQEVPPKYFSSAVDLRTGEPLELAA